MIFDEAINGHIGADVESYLFEFVPEFVVVGFEEGGVNDTDVNATLVGVKPAFRAAHVLFIFIEEK